MSEQFQRKFKGVWIPADVWLNTNLSITEKVMLVEIDSLHNTERGCYASNAHFAKFFGLSPSRVSEIISSLASKGMVSVELIREGKRVVERRVYMKEVFDKPNTYSENALKGIRETEEGYSGKAEGSNTKSSNTKKESFGASAPPARGTNKPPPVDEQFEEAWGFYPPRSGSRSKVKAMEAWNARRKEGVPAEDMLQGVIRYAAYCAAKGSIGTEFVMQAARFFGKGREYENDWVATAGGKPPPSGPNFDDKSWADDLYEGGL